MSSSGSKVKTVFVTVGSTKFEELINHILKADTLNLLKKHSFYRLILQIGNGKHEEDADNLADLPADGGVKKFFKQNLEIIVYRYKPSLRDDLDKADLVISHAGAGSILEALEAGKKLIVVVNENLMNNHQFELAEKLFDVGFLLYTTCRYLSDKLELISCQEFALKKYEPGNPKLFGKHLNQLVMS